MHASLNQISCISNFTTISHDQVFFNIDFTGEAFTSLVSFIAHPINSKKKDIDVSKYFIMKGFMILLLNYYA